jgi:multicomponent Na+:H+ antiporter subunit E
MSNHETTLAEAPKAGSSTRRGGGIVTTALRFFLLFGLWVLLSGMLDPLHLGLGVLSSAFVTWLSYDIFPDELKLWLRPMSVLYMVAFILWLMVEIIKANAAMLRLVFRKDIEAHIDPKIVKLQTRLRNPMALTIFANSITLTPGTITVTVNGKGEFSVHTIDSKSAESLPGEMERKIARIFGE